MIQWYAFDSMGLFGFGLDSGLLTKQAPNDGFTYMNSALGLLGPFTPAIWIPRLAFAYARGVWRVKHWFQMLEFSDMIMEACMKTRSRDTPTHIASAFAEDYRHQGKTSKSDRVLSGDGANLLVAASDSSGVSNAFLLYCLAKHPEHAEKLRQELQGVEDTEDVMALARLPHLNGFINESLRLFPAIPTAISRIVPADGLTIKDVFIPGGTKLCAPRWSIHRLENAFVDAHEFIPERWYSQPELIKAPRAFAPFDMGRTLCVGKSLALAQMRLLTARLVPRYRISFAPGQAREDAAEADMKDQLEARPGPMKIVFDQI